jgi:hypothetical protein
MSGPARDIFKKAALVVCVKFSNLFLLILSYGGGVEEGAAPSLPDQLRRAGSLYLIQKWNLINAMFYGYILLQFYRRTMEVVILSQQ